MEDILLVLFKMPVAYGIIILIFIPVYGALKDKAPAGYGALFLDTAARYLLGATGILTIAWAYDITPPVWNDTSPEMVAHVGETIWGHIVPLFVLPLVCMLLKWHRRTWGAVLMTVACFSPMITSGFWKYQFHKDDQYMVALSTMVIVFGCSIAVLAKFRSQRKAARAAGDGIKKAG